MTTEPQEHDFITQVCAEDAARRVPPRLSDDPAVRLAECQGAAPMQSFNREDRYVVIKRSDLQHAGHHELIAFHNANFSLRESMSKNGVKDRQFLVIESDWPEYETVWGMIESRMTGNAPAFEEQAERVKFERWFLTKYCGGHERLKRCSNAPDFYYYSDSQEKWIPWLACAKSRAEGK